MAAPVLTQVEETAQSLAESVRAAGAGQEAIWQLTGPPTAGKTTCLVRIGELLRTEGVPTIFVSPPSNQLDAGPIALAQVAVQLAELDRINGAVAHWIDEPGAWSDRSAAVRQWMTENDDVVLLCDEPRAWGGHRESEDLFAQHGWDAAYLLGSLPVRRICTGGSLPVPLRPLESHTLPWQSPGQAWLRDETEWGGLALVAQGLADEDVAGREWTPLQLRLLVAAAAATSVDRVVEWQRDGAPSQLVAFAADCLQGSSYRDAWELWLRLSPTRQALDEETIRRLTPRSLDERAGDLVRRCLLYQSDNGALHLHDILKMFIARQQRSSIRGAAATSADKAERRWLSESNRTLFEIHRERFDRASVDGESRAVLHSLEAFHFAAATGDAALVRSVGPSFVDQLDALGWRLSYEHRRFDLAADAFRAALKWDPADDYAHHYLAFNLERQGQRDLEVEQHYRRAVEVNDHHTWWWSRLVSHLIGRGETTAALDVWLEAELVLNVESPDTSAELYETLHCWVAGACLDSGEPRLARRLLDEIPIWARSEISIFGVLDQRADALLQVGEGPPVVPGWRLASDWWLSGPELLQPRLGAGQRLVKWLAARVERVDEDGVGLRAAVISPSVAEAPAIAWTVISRDDFDEACRDEIRARDVLPGMFLEVGLFADPDGAGPLTTLIRVLPDRRWSTAGLPITPQLTALA